MEWVDSWRENGSLKKKKEKKKNKTKVGNEK